MTIRELSELLGVSEITVRRAIQKQFPDLIKHGIETILTFEQSKRVIGSLKVSASARIKAVEKNTDVLRQNVGLDTESITSMLRAAADAIESRDKQISILAPKAEVHDRIADSTGRKSVAEMAQILGTGQKRLFKFMRDSGILTEHNRPYQSHIDTGRLIVRDTVRMINNHAVAFPQVFFTGKGEVWIAEVFGSIANANRLLGG